jgi:hypothetical protein
VLRRTGLPHYREEVLNVYLAELLSDRGIASVPESIATHGKKRGRKMPDVVVDFFGLRVMLEGKVGDVQQAHKKALGAARNRLEQGVAQIGVAVVYPASLRNAPDIKTELERSDLDFAVVTESQEADYVTGKVDYLKNVLTLAFEQLVKEDVVAEAVAALNAGISLFSESVIGKSGVIKRLAGCLDLAEPKKAKEKPKHIISTAHISGLVITNAMIFQEILADSDARIWPLNKIESEADVIGNFVKHWKTIVEDINYYPIFHIARQLLVNLASGQDLDAFQSLIDAAKAIVRNKAALRHDLMGRVYHRLLGDAKYLGTYYTSIPAATLLLRLALNADDWEIDWADLDSLQSFRLADFACGTGTLLMTAADALANNYISEAVAVNKDIELGQLHKVLVESVIYGYDVLVSAIHLTAATLAMRTPNVVFEKMNLISMSLGGRKHKLGSLEFFRDAQMTAFSDIFGAVSQGERVTGSNEVTVQVPSPPKLDLCVMNPPFTRSVGGNLLFGSSPPAEREAMQRDLKKLIRALDVPASATAGLGAIFVALGDKYLKLGGRIALVLPKALISGAAWSKTRDLLRDKYQVEILIVSQDPTQWNFSESTSLSEVLLIARKVREAKYESEAAKTKPAEGVVVALNLWRNPQTSFEVLPIAQALLCQNQSDVAIGQGTTSLRVGTKKMGEAVSFAWDDLRNRESWMLPCAFAQTELIRATYHLLDGKLRLPGSGQTAAINLTLLKKLGELGPDRRDVYDGFELTEEKTAYAAFWGHDAESVQTLSQPVTHHLNALSQARKGRSLRKAEQLWPRAGRLLIAERMRLNTQGVFAIRLPQPVLANVWWSFTPIHEINKAAEKVLTLWLNSTLGLLILFANRDETEGAWVDFKKPSLYALPVLDVLHLTPTKTANLASVYDQLCNVPLHPFPNMADDSVRVQIDKALAQTLELPDFSVLRELLAQEPVVCLKKLP